jgi:hypothetical protein
MNKKQFFMLTLLICPLFHSNTVQSGVLRKLICVSLTVAAGMEIYVAGEYNKSLPAEKQTRLSNEGHPYLDATVGFAQTTAEMGTTVFSKSAEYCKNATVCLRDQREKVLPALLQQYYPFSNGKTAGDILREIEKAHTPQGGTPSTPSETESTIPKKEDVVPDPSPAVPSSNNEEHK